ncbi:MULTISPECIES: acyl-CoA dehydrogenase family protein [Eubacterium]|uniref:Butyryl-CoA dehydrogenase n=1 Tax=Eubacterium barkeri TaxID=1528 RepID=A0A1H3IHS4_EUBBA|nr:acyl-CoA dehydrogenase family protein [Eubacterium barkeri]SDY27356.1 butyryl-CoA dehydrogenase [Eubacterium barkeri]
MAYLISDEAKDLLQDVKEFCENEVKEQCKEYDRSGEWPKEIYDKAIEMQLHSLEIPEEYGGPGLSRVDIAALMEEMAKADAGFATTISASGLGTKPVLIAGTEEQKKKVCQIIVDGGFGAFALTEPGAGSDPAAGTTTAVKDGDDYVLNGRKCFITNGGIADFYCVTALTDKSAGVKGMSMFLIEKGTPGLSTGNEEDKMGIRTSNTCDVVMEDCRIPAANLIGAEGKGFGIAMKTLDQARTWMGCVSTGIAQRAMEEAMEYCKGRVQFGKPVIKFQAMQFKIADMAMKIEVSRQMVAHSLTLMDLGLPFAKESAIAKCYASDRAMEVTTEAVQMFGGYGYSREYPVEKLMRDAKIFQIFEGSNEILHIVTANNTIPR